ncbi:MAG TPA: efflux RND transporter permease subunit [Candidatus Brocadiia bacterium]|nr:efflux RND transporter permease subunit [Candidatus Brocadiia bacterium]
MKSFLNVTARHGVFANILMSCIIIGGYISAKSLVLELMPQISVDIIKILVVYPGAAPEEVEEGICAKLEDATRGVKGVKRCMTVAAENGGSALVECKENADVDKVMEEVRNRVNSITTFPAGAERPVISEITTWNDVCYICLYGDLPEGQMVERARDIKEALVRLPEVSQVSVHGVRDYEISIELSDEKLREYNLSLDKVSAAVKYNTLNLPGGKITGRKEEILIRTMGRRYTGKEFADMVVMGLPDGTMLRLEQIATIKDSFAEDEISGRFNGVPAVLLGVYKTTDEDVVEVSNAVTKFVEEYAPTLPPGAKLTKWADTSRLVRQRVAMLRNNGIFGLCVVFLLLWFFLDIRLSFWIAMGIPVSLSGSCMLMATQGASMDMLSMFAMIMMLGLIVDDAIVTGEAIYTRRSEGESQIESAVNGTAEIIWPVLAALLTTIVAFIPLFFVQGVIGKLIKVIPLIVIGSLSVSFLECIFLLPAHLNHLPKVDAETMSVRTGFSGRVRTRIMQGMIRFLDVVYGPILRATVEWRYCAVAFALSVCVASAGLVAGGHIKFTFMPENDQDFLVGNVEFPDGTPIEVTLQALTQMEEGLRRTSDKLKTQNGEPLFRAMYSLAGAEGDSMASLRGPHKGQISVELLPSEKRNIFFKDILTTWKDETGPVAGASVVNYRAIDRAPGGKPVEVWLLGRDQEEMLKASRELQDKLKTLAGVYNVQDDFRAGKKELRITLKPEAKTLGLTVADLAVQLNSGFYGSEAARIQRGRDDIKVKVRYPLDERRTISDLMAIRVRTPFGSEVPFGAVAQAELKTGYSTIWRKEGLRRVVVTADVNDNIANGREIMSDLTRNYLDSLISRHPGVIYSIEGEALSTQETMDSLYVGFAMAVMGIFVILAAIFRSYCQPLVIMVTVPFGLIGAVLGHVLLGFNLTVMSLFGMVALTGVVVNDAIVMVDCVNSMVASGMTFEASLEAGGKRRFRAIILTTVTTCAGMASLIAERSMQAQFILPMAIAITFGVAFATLLTLFFIPCLLAILNDMRRFTRWVFTGRWPSMEEVEPAYKHIAEAASSDYCVSAGLETGERG